MSVSTATRPSITPAPYALTSSPIQRTGLMCVTMKAAARHSITLALWGVFTFWSSLWNKALLYVIWDVYGLQMTCTCNCMCHVYHHWPQRFIYYTMLAAQTVIHTRKYCTQVRCRWPILDKFLVIFNRTWGWKVEGLLHFPHYCSYTAAQRTCHSLYCSY